MLLLCVASSSIGYFVSSLFSREETAVMISPLITMPLFLFSGFFSNNGSYPEWIGWFQWVSPVTYSVGAMVRNEFGNREYAPGEVDMVEYLAYDLSIGVDIIILVALAVLFRVITGITLKLLAGKF